MYYVEALAPSVGKIKKRASMEGIKVKGGY